jgi:hypothetical protein
VLAGGLTLVLLLGAHRVAAQTRADSTKSTPSGDSAATRSQDTSAAVTAPSGAPDSGAPRPAVPSPALPPPPVDSVLARACGSAPAGGSAPGLLAVVFKASAADSDRVAAAREVGGTLARGSGKEYVLIPVTGEAMRVAAARLIRLSSVSSLSEMPCPRP